MKRLLNWILNVILPWRWWFAFRNHIDTITQSGYVSKISPVVMTVTRVFFRIWTWIQVGKVTVVNRQYLETPGRVVFCANHSSMLDVICAFPQMTRECRAIGAVEPLRAFFGLPAIVLSKIGVVPVDRSRGKTVIQPCIDLVAQGWPLGLFPEGKISATGELLPFKAGVALIANGAYDKLQGKEKVAIVPAHFCYGKRHAPSAFNYLKMGLRWRGGVTLTICQPIWLHELENRDVDTILSLVRKAIENVECASTI